MKKRQIYIHDTTLREGNQSRLGNFSIREKILIANLLRKLGVDSIEVWFGSASQKEDNDIKKIISEIWSDNNSPIISILTGLDKRFVDKTMQILSWADKKRICLLTSGSDKHINIKFASKGISEKDRKDNILNLIKENTILAVSNWFEIQITTEDSTKADRWYLLDSIIVAIESWAKVINLPDTIWSSSFWEIEELFKFIYEKTSYLRQNWYNFILSSHHHNDMGLATANNLSAIRWGALALETSILGIWDRVGISSCEETILNLIEKSETILDWEKIVLPNIKKELIWPVSTAMSHILGISIDPNRPLLWANNNIHWAGIHNSANRKGKSMWEWWNIYESISLSKYGIKKPRHILSATWWRGEVISVLADYGIELGKTDEIVEKITARYKEEASVTKWIYPAKIFVLYLEEKGFFNLYDTDIKLFWNMVDITFKILDKDINIIWKWEKDNWVVDATINWLNKFFRDIGQDLVISVWEFSEEVRFNEEEIVDNFNKNVSTDMWLDFCFFDEDREQLWSKKITITELTLNIRGEIIPIKAWSHSAEIWAIKAIIYASIWEIYNIFRWQIS